MPEPEFPTIDLGESPRILLVRMSAIGDVVVATPVIRALRERYPRAYLAWLVEDRAQDVLRGNPDLDAVIVYPRQAWKRELTGPVGRLRHLRRVARLVRELRAHRFDVAVDFQGLLRSALLAHGSGARHRIANTGTKEGSGHLYTIRVPRPATGSSRQRCLDLLQPLDVRSTDRRLAFPISEDDRAAAAHLLREAGVTHGTPYACLCPATTWANKHWTESGWARLAEGLIARGITPVFLGARGDLPLIERICRFRISDFGFRIWEGPLRANKETQDAQDQESSGHSSCTSLLNPGRPSEIRNPKSEIRNPAVLAGRTTLKQAAALLEGAAVGVAVDTGLLHIGVAVGARMVGLVGPSFWPGFEDYESARVRILRKPFACSPCLRHPTCDYTPEMEAYACMLALAPEEVLAETDALMAAERMSA